MFYYFLYLMFMFLSLKKKKKNGGRGRGQEEKNKQGMEGEITFPTPCEFVINRLCHYVQKVLEHQPRGTLPQGFDNAEVSSRTAESKTKDGRLPPTGNRH